MQPDDVAEEVDENQTNVRILADIAQAGDDVVTPVLGVDQRALVEVIEHLAFVERAGPVLAALLVLELVLPC